MKTTKDKCIKELRTIIHLQSIELDRIYDELTEQDKENERLNNIIIELSEKNRNLLEDNMMLRKEINLHSGKLYISDIEVKNVF